MVLDGLLFEPNFVADEDVGGDDFTPFFIRNTYHQRIINDRMGFENFLDFLWVYLLAGSVEAYTTAAKQNQASVSLYLVPIIRH